MMEKYLDIGRKIKERRKALGLTLRDVSGKLGCTPTTLKRWEDGYVKTVKSNRIADLASILDTSPGYLLGYEDEPIVSYQNVKDITSKKQIPIIGEISAGKGIIANEPYDKTVTIPENIKADFAVEVRGDSMINARLFDGDLVFIEEQPDVRDGEIAAVIIDHEVFLKRMYHYEERIELRSENPLYESINFVGLELGSVKILGKATAVLGEIK